MRLHAALLLLAALAAAASAFLPRVAVKDDPAAVRTFVEETIRLSRANAPRSDPLALTLDSLPTTSRHPGGHSFSTPAPPTVMLPMATAAAAEEQEMEEEHSHDGDEDHDHDDADDDHHHEDDDGDHEDDDEEEKKQCKTNTRFDRVISLAASFNTSEDVYELVDSDNIFLKVGLGLTDAQIAEQKEDALKFFERQFGVPRSKFDMPKTFAEGSEPSGRMAFYPVVLSQRNNIIADNTVKVPCADAYALWGGFTAVGKNITLNGEFSGRMPVHYPGTVTFFNFAMVFAPGTPQVRKLLFRGIRPLACDFTGCTLSAITTTIEEGFVGDADGSIQVEPPMIYTRLMLTWPSRYV